MAICHKEITSKKYITNSKVKNSKYFPHYDVNRENKKSFSDAFIVNSITALYNIYVHFEKERPL